MTVRLLPPTLINQIAAGEVIERPASAVKELVENALDAQASHIHIHLRDGGRAALIVSDNGVGMSKEDLCLSMERHATSKIPDENLFNIQTLGFRGEALPSIGSVSRTHISSCQKDQEHGWTLTVEGGTKSNPQPIPMNPGTRVEVRDLFYAIPARLKFLRSASTETQRILDMIKGLSLSYPHVHFLVDDEKKSLLDLHPHNDEEKGVSLNRLKDILGPDFSENALVFSSDQGNESLWGAIGLPTLHRATSSYQYLFVNGRPVKDKVLQGALRAAYSDYMPHDRHPMVVLFLQLDPMSVDMNVHPAKTEVRFRDVQKIRSLLVSTLKTTLNQGAHRCASPPQNHSIFKSSPIIQDTLPLMDSHKGFRGHKENSSWKEQQTFLNQGIKTENHDRGYPYTGYALHDSGMKSYEYQTLDIQTDSKDGPISEPSKPPISSKDHGWHPPLGHARAQVKETYIIAEKPEGLVIVDQHAVHERIVYENLKKTIEGKSQRQILLVPEVITLNEEHIKGIRDHQDTLKKMGLIFDIFGSDTLIIREVPMILGDFDIKGLIYDIADHISDYHEPLILEEKIRGILSSFACRHSIRAGKKMSLPEMDALLREMEKTPYIGQCNHGRPTYVEIPWKDIDRFFDR